MLRLRATQALQKSKKPAVKPQLNSNQKPKPKQPNKKATANVVATKVVHAIKPSTVPVSKPRVEATSNSTSKPPRASPTVSKTDREIESTTTVRRPFGKIALGGAFFVAFLLSGYSTFVFFSYRRDAEEAAARGIPADVSDRYQRTAESFDDEVDTWEWRLGILAQREKLVAKAKGHVLEMSVGTGRNIPYLPLLDGKVESITMVDKNSEMIRMARKKWTNTHPWFINTSFRVQSAANPIPKPNGEGFDTIIQTMGICSTPEPEAVLKNMGKLCKKDGRILLLEHGKSYYKWLNNILDQFAPAHADRHGCWWNKDIGDIVEKSGLEVVEMKRSNLGTTWWYELKPGTIFEEEGAVIPESMASIQQSISESASKLYSWIRSEWNRRTSS